MFSIAAINESDSGGQWEPLAPTKEAQEFALSQKYHEGLLKLQQKDYPKARELLEDVDNIGSDQHLLQLRFLTLKNLASVFFQQGLEFYDNALHCYLQAVELDSNDSVVWNHLGNCMEKLLEVLIAIGDEVACLSVANLILRSWPSHHRALHVKKTIECAEPIPFAPRDTIKSVESAGENGNDSHHDGETASPHDCKTTVKDKDVNSDREHPHERRSTRLERLRSRKSGKDENGPDGKDISHAVTQFLDSFILKGSSAAEKVDFSGNADASNPDTLTYTSDDEANDVKSFLYCKEKAYKEFNIALSILRNGNKDSSGGEVILLPHTKLVKSLTADRILREINLIRLESLLWNNDENINKITHTEFMKLLPPLVLSTKDVYVGNAYGPQRESENVISLELSALDVLISACEKAKPMNIQGKGSGDMDIVEAMNRNRLENVVEAVKDVSRNASKAKDFIDQCDNSVDQLESSCLIDAAIAFCKLQHLDPTISIRTQVDLIVAVHDLLAEYGLCCSGKDGEGEEGTFLKFAIKHLMALDVKLKSQLNSNGMEEDVVPKNAGTQDTMVDEPLVNDSKQNSEDEEDEEESGERGYEAFKKLSTASSEPYSDVYGNLYFYIAQSEDISATDKHAGFVLKKEGEEFVEQSANIFKYDLLYNPLRFESWQKLSNLYDEFALCLGDIVPVGLGKYLQVLIAAINNPEIRRASGDASVEQLLEKMFSVFMDHANLWADISTIPEVNSPELSESNLYSYIHQYIHLLESDVRLDVLEGLNEKIRKRFKTPKLSNSNFAKICKHASLAWCQCILIKLASITPLPESMDATNQPAPLSNGLLLYVDLQPDELLISSPDGPAQFKGLDMNWFETLNRIKNIPIKQTSEDNLETAVTLMKSTYNFYRESSCGTFPSGINMYTVTPSPAPIEGVPQAPPVVETLDLSIPRKLLLWVYTLVHGRYSNISSVVKYCDEMKSRSKRGTSTAAAASQVVQPIPQTASSQAKEKSAQVESTEAAQDANPSAQAAHQEALGTSASQAAIDSQLNRSGSSRAMENTPDSMERK
nr:unnamed protein product [Digitaria exilis]